jgi:AraC-like DNA-binding protein
MIRDDPGERLFFFRPEALAGAEVMSAYGSLQPWHIFHETYAFCACRTAAAGWRYRRGSHFLNDGSIMLLEPGEVHRNTTVHKRSDFKLLLISPHMFAEAARELDIVGTPHFGPAQIDDARLFETIYRLSAAVESGDTLLHQQSLMADCMRRLLGHAESKPRSPERGQEHRAVARIKLYLEDLCHEAVTLDELSANAGVSRFRLIHAFTREVGLPPHAYQIHVRIERARLLLWRGMSVTDVAAELGFSDQSHFTRHFTRIMRITPGEYARVGSI